MFKNMVEYLNSIYLKALQDTSENLRVKINMPIFVALLNYYDKDWDKAYKVVKAIELKVDKIMAENDGFIVEECVNLKSKLKVLLYAMDMVCAEYLNNSKLSDSL